MAVFFPVSQRGRLLSLAVATTAAALAVQPQAIAQQRRSPPRAPTPTALGKDLQTGVVAKVGPGMLVLQLPKGQGDLWAAMPAPSAVVEVWGTASREVLQPRQFVRCAVPLDDASKPAGPAEEVIVAESGVAGVALRVEADPPPGRRRISARRSAGTYLISGSIQQIEGDTITVLAGRERFGITVPAETRLRVVSRNVALAAEGDEVEVEGSYFQKGQLMVTSLKIVLAKPMEPPPGR